MAPGRYRITVTAIRSFGNGARFAVRYVGALHVFLCGRQEGLSAGAVQRGGGMTQRKKIELDENEWRLILLSLQRDMEIQEGIIVFGGESSHECLIAQNRLNIFERLLFEIRKQLDEGI